jgi:hypothetical protein
MFGLISLIGLVCTVCRLIDVINLIGASPSTSIKYHFWFGLLLVFMKYDKNFSTISLSIFTPIEFQLMVKY